mmetsp:Transcript_19999/g.22257  ORF Transcript_19999/g.22257 Transcript_19999/m.22257 type:complete len:309 (-) Transcript_19999:151-1077(-)
MWKNTTTLLLVLLAALVASQQFDVPVLVWSGQQYSPFNHDKAPVSQATYTNYFDNLLETSRLTTLASKSASAPEVIVIYMHEELRTDQVTNYFANGVYSNLQTAIKNGASSTSASGPSGPSLLRLIPKIDGTIIYAGRGDPFGAAVETSITIDELEAHLIDNSGIFADGSTDLIIIRFKTKYDQLSSDEIVGKVNTLISKETSQYVSVFTAELATAPDCLFTVPGQSKRSIEQNPTGPTGPTVAPTEAPSSNTTEQNWFEKYFPGWFWTSFLVNFFIFIVLMIGLCALADIQVHDKFETPKVRRGGEE